MPLNKETKPNQCSTVHNSNIYIYIYIYIYILSLFHLIWPYVVSELTQTHFGLVSLFNGISTFVGYLMAMLFS